MSDELCLMSYKRGFMEKNFNHLSDKELVEKAHQQLDYAPPEFKKKFISGIYAWACINGRPLIGGQRKGVENVIREWDFMEANTF